MFEAAALQPQPRLGPNINITNLKQLGHKGEISEL